MEYEQILRLTDTCVKCGLCLPHCPTYRQLRCETDSPRGRIALVQGLLRGQLASTTNMVQALDRCLECRACESMCPASTPITKIIDAVRSVHVNNQSKLQRYLHLWLLRLAVRPAAIVPLLKFYQLSGLRSLVQRYLPRSWVKLRLLEQLLPQRLLTRVPFGLSQAVADTTTSTSIPQEAKYVALFPGCLGRVSEAAVLTATIKILTHLGYNVYLPDEMCCCGALYRHDGFAAAAEQELDRTTVLLAKYQKILVLASACLDGLRHTMALAERVVDATEFIANATWPNNLLTNGEPLKVLVHVPCSQRHPFGNPQSAMTLLARLPGIDLQELPANDTCCGAAGTYMLRQQGISTILLADKLKLITTITQAPAACVNALSGTDSQPPLANIVATTNTGCALRLAAGLHNEGSTVRVCHPLEILAMRLRTKNN